MNIIDVNNIKKIGYIDEIIDGNLNLFKTIQNLKRKKNAYILAHYYQLPEVQEIADFVGDSLALAQKAERINSDIIVLAGVSFMAETAKILAPQKKVLFPDLNAGCSLADSCQFEYFKDFLQIYPDYKVVSYVNSYASIKTLSYACCTSSNAVNIINCLKKEKIVFTPDQNLGNYVKEITGKEDMIIWNGACHVHKRFSLPRLLELKKKNTEAIVIAHPECDNTILINSDFIGSTSQLVDYVRKSDKSIFLVNTEPGVIHRMKKENFNKTFIPVPPDDSDCACNECYYMKMINLKKIYLTLKYELPEIYLDQDTIDKARIPIKRMLELS